MARAIAAANAQEPALDITVKSDPHAWAEKLNGRVLSTGSVRAIASGPVSQLAGYNEGAWWIQDAAAALPARLICNVLGDVRGKSVADLCAAPGGKTAQLAQAGAQVTAVDRSQPRLARLQQNLARLQLSAEIVKADAAEWQGGPFDAVLVDAPCSSTGTIRRHPDIPWLKSEVDIGVPDSLGGTEKGISIAARPAAQVTAPCDGWVVYAGPFRNYGQLLILNAGGGYHVVLAGMDRISVDVGQFVLTGEPVAVMGGGAHEHRLASGDQSGARAPISRCYTSSSARTVLPSIPARGGRQVKAKRFADDAQDISDSPRCGCRARP